MCMSCNTRKLTKKKIILISSLGGAAIVGSYFILIDTNNPAFAAAIPAISGFAICPAMCAAMGSIMWIKKRLSSKNKNKSKNKNYDQVSSNLETEKEVSSPSCSIKSKDDDCHIITKKFNVNPRLNN